MDTWAIEGLCNACMWVLQGFCKVYMRVKEISTRLRLTYKIETFLPRGFGYQQVTVALKPVN